MKIKFAPSILSADFTQLGSQLQETERAGVPYAHIDVMDGDFVPQISFGQPVIASVRKATRQFFDVHLMVNHPETFVPSMAESGADSITFHLEAAENPQLVIDKIREHGCKVGISVKPRTPIEAILPYIHEIDMLLIMTVEPGFGGQSYIPSSTEKIRRARKIFDDAGIAMDIEVDGGIKLDNVDVVLEAGANVIVAGSAVYKGDVYEKSRAFMDHFASWEETHR